MGSNPVTVYKLFCKRTCSSNLFSVSITINEILLLWTLVGLEKFWQNGKSNPGQQLMQTPLQCGRFKETLVCRHVRMPVALLLFCHFVFLALSQSDTKLESLEGCIAQRLLSCFLPSRPGFDSRHSPKFISMLLRCT